MALHTQRIALGPQVEDVRLMTIRATYAGAVHLALHVRPVDVHLIQHLTIGVIQAGSQTLRHKIIEQVAPVLVIDADLPPARMAASTLRHLSRPIELRKIYDQPF